MKAQKQDLRMEMLVWLWGSGDSQSDQLWGADLHQSNTTTSCIAIKLSMDIPLPKKMNANGFGDLIFPWELLRGKNIC